MPSFPIGSGRASKVVSIALASVTLSLGIVVTGASAGSAATPAAARVPQPLPDCASCNRMVPVNGGESPFAAPATGSRSPILPHVGLRTTGANGEEPAEDYPGWSGYVANEETYTRVQGAWTVPWANCGQNSPFEWSESTTWVGLGGTPTSHPLEQVATESECHNGIPDYYAWTEMWPQEPEVLPLDEPSGVHYPVVPGDKMFGYVQANATGTEYTMWLTDETQGWSTGVQNAVLTTGTPAEAESTAEWITEFGGGCGTCTYLTDFGAVFFSAASAIGNNQPGVISAFPYYPVNMERTDYNTSPPTTTVMAEALDLTAGGTSFEDLWVNG